LSWVGGVKVCVWVGYTRNLKQVFYTQLAATLFFILAMPIRQQ